MTIRVRYLLPLALLLAAATAAAFVDTYQWSHPLPQGNSVNNFVFRDAGTGWAACGGGTLMQTLDGGVSWQLLHGPDGAAGDFADAVLAPSGALVVAGDTGVRRSTDDGATLDPIALPTAAELRDLCVIPGGGLSAAGTDGSVLVSWDDGLTWTDVGPGTGEVRHHLWRTSTEGYVVGDGLAHRTTDGGATWTQLFPPNFLGMNEVYFTADGTGVILEDFARWVSTDGGASWTEINAGAGPLYRFRTVEASPGHLFTVAFLEGCELWESTDGGVAWTQLQLHRTVGFPSLTLTPGGRLIWGSDAGDLFWSDDDGATIHNAAVNLTPGAPLAPIDAFVDRGDGVVFAANQPSGGSDTQAWLRSDDAGATWSVPAAVPGLRWIDAGGFSDPDHGVVTYRHFVRRTADGGATWQAADLADGTRTWDAALPAADRWFLATSQTGGGGDLLRSTDAGATWTPVGGGLPTGSFAAGVIRFADALHGWTAGTVGSAWRLYATADGGATWQQRAAAGLAKAPSDLVLFDAATGLASVQAFGGEGIYRTTDGGASWTQVSTERIQSLVFRDTQEGVAMLFYADRLLHTADAGLTWTPATPPFGAPGPGITIVQTTAALPVADGWLLGGSANRILRGLTDTASAVTPGATPASAAVRLLGASPNPFNPSTEIAFRTAAAGPVRVAVHDAAGRLVRVLTAEVREAGRHAVRWDGRDDAGVPAASGVYLVRVAGPRGVDRGKITLVK